MKKFVLVIACLLSGPSFAPAYASICVDGKASVKAELAESKYVLTGKVISIGKFFRKYYSYKNGRTFDDYQKISVKVTSVYKGKPGREMSFYSSNDSARIPVEIGEDWLFFFSGTNDWKRVEVDNCGLTAKLPDDDTALTIAELRKLTTGTHGS